MTFIFECDCVPLAHIGNGINNLVVIDVTGFLHYVGVVVHNLIALFESLFMYEIPQPKVTVEL